MKYQHIFTASILLLLLSSALAFGATRQGVFAELWTYPSNLTNLDAIEAHIKSGGGTNHGAGVFDSIDFPVTTGNFTHRNGVFFTGAGYIDYFYARFTAAVNIPITGKWAFPVESDDGFRLKIDGQKVAEFTATRGYDRTEGTLDLTAGFHSMELTYFEATGAAGLKLLWSPVYPTGTVKKNQALSNSDLDSNPIRLTTNAPGVNGQLEFSDPSWLGMRSAGEGDEWEVSGTFTTGGRSGADGADAFYIYAYANSTPTNEDAAVGGFSINYDEFQDQIQFKQNGSQVTAVSKNDIDNSQPHSFKVTMTRFGTGYKEEVFMDGSSKLFA
ncbi:hypothetical protein HYR99_26075, partial [Candidatus Poribacteria bacterium]|nr:hypothetical protein [Candidatus Poribacteria bacterium]